MKTSLRRWIGGANDDAGNDDARYLIEGGYALLSATPPYEWADHFGVRGPASLSKTTEGRGDGDARRSSESQRRPFEALDHRSGQVAPRFGECAYVVCRRRRGPPRVAWAGMLVDPAATFFVVLLSEPLAIPWPARTRFDYYCVPAAGREFRTLLDDWFAAYRDLVDDEAADGAD